MGRSFGVDTIYDNTDAKVQKYGDQIGLETLVVHTLTYEC